MEEVKKLQISLESLTDEGMRLATSSVEECKKGDYASVSTCLAALHENAKSMFDITKEQNKQLEALPPPAPPKRTFLSYYPGIAFLFGAT